MSVYSKVDLKGADGADYDGSAANRYDRDYVNMGKKDTNGDKDDRKERQLDKQSDERKSRLYVKDGVSATGASYTPEDNEEGVVTSDNEDDE